MSAEAPIETISSDRSAHDRVITADDDRGDPGVDALGDVDD